MATVTRTHGSAFGVPHVDRAQAGSGAITADEAVILDGPQLDFFSIVVQTPSDVNVDLRDELDAGEAVEGILTEIQTRGTIAMYQVEGDTTGHISVAVYPQGVWTAATLQTALRALTPNSLEIGGTDVTAPGFELV